MLQGSPAASRTNAIRRGKERAIFADVIPLRGPARPRRNTQQVMADAYRFLDRNADYRLGHVARDPGLLSVGFENTQSGDDSFTLFVRENGVAHATGPNADFLAASKTPRHLLGRLEQRLRAQGGVSRRPSTGFIGERGKFC